MREEIHARSNINTPSWSHALLDRASQQQTRLKDNFSTSNIPGTTIHTYSLSDPISAPPARAIQAIPSNYISPIQAFGLRTQHDAGYKENVHDFRRSPAESLRQASRFPSRQLVKPNRRAPGDPGREERDSAPRSPSNWSYSASSVRG
jgi:hypothetical protein